MCNEALPLSDWLMLVKACLSEGEYSLWKSNGTEYCSEQAETNRIYRVDITLDMLTGTGRFVDLGQQLNYDLQTYAQISVCARRAWKELPTKGEKVLDLNQIQQGPKENFLDFVEHLYQAASHVTGDPNTSEILVKQLDFENANKVHQEVI